MATPRIWTGAIGALDAAMLIGLPGFDPAALIATLLLYRLLYFVAPFGLALAGLGAREAYIHFRRRDATWTHPGHAAFVGAALVAALPSCGRPQGAVSRARPDAEMRDI